MNVHVDNNMNMMSFAGNGDEVAIVDVTDAGTGGTKYWPHLKILFKDHKEVVLRIFKGIKDCGCTSEVNANNGNNTKANNWTKFYDCCYGGNQGHGLLAPYLDMIPMIGNVTKLKKKVMEMWKYTEKESSKPNSVVDKDLLVIGVQQLKEYEATVAKEKVAMEKNKFANEKTLLEMEEYEASTGAMPPAVVGLKGGGRQQHSTNLKTCEPATYAYANATTNPDDEDDDIELPSGIVRKVVTPKTTSAKKQKTVHNKSSASVFDSVSTNLQSQIDILMLNGGNTVAKKTKLENLQDQLVIFQNSISFCKDIPGLEEEYEEAMEGYKAILKELKQEMKKALTVTEANDE
jgi:hypothetical protein